MALPTAVGACPRACVLVTGLRFIPLPHTLGSSMFSIKKMPALALAAAATLASLGAHAAPISLSSSAPGWLAIWSGDNLAGNHNINTAGLAFEAANGGWNTSNAYND